MAKTFEIDFQYKLPEYGQMEFTARDRDDAEDLAEKYVRETFEDATDIEITGVREVV
jgi:hypothetical protein